ncbi:MAG: BON domain-containing protein [Methylophilaceae bacterium]
MYIDKMKLAASVMTLALGLVACEKPTSAEKAGEKMDQAAERAGDKMDQAAERAGDKMDQTAEKAGDKMDQTAEKLSEQTTKTGTVLEDTSITTKVKTEILNEPGLKSLDISVHTVSGVVTLTGMVDSQASSDKAKQVAGAVSGVHQVENQLIVKSPG